MSWPYILGPPGPPGPAGPAPVVAYANLSIQGNATATSLPLQNTWYQVTAGWAAGVSSGMTPQAGSADIRCDTAGAFLLQCVATHINAGLNNDVVEFGLFRNGALIAQSVVAHQSDGVHTDEVTLMMPAVLASTDTISLGVRCTGGAGHTITITNANLVVSTM